MGCGSSRSLVLQRDALQPTETTDPDAGPFRLFVDFSCINLPSEVLKYREGTAVVVWYRELESTTHRKWSFHSRTEHVSRTSNPQYRIPSIFFMRGKVHTIALPPDTVAPLAPELPSSVRHFNSRKKRQQTVFEAVEDEDHPSRYDGRSRSSNNNPSISLSASVCRDAGPQRLVRATLEKDFEIKVCVHDASHLTNEGAIRNPHKKILGYTIAKLSDLIGSPQHYPLVNMRDVHVNRGAAYIRMEAVPEEERDRRREQKQQEEEKLKAAGTSSNLALQAELQDLMGHAIDPDNFIALQGLMDLSTSASNHRLSVASRASFPVLPLDQSYSQAENRSTRAAPFGAAPPAAATATAATTITDTTIGTAQTIMDPPDTPITTNSTNRAATTSMNTTALGTTNIETTAGTKTKRTFVVIHAGSSGPSIGDSSDECTNKDSNKDSNGDGMNDHDDISDCHDLGINADTRKFAVTEGSKDSYTHVEGDYGKECAQESFKNDTREMEWLSKTTDFDSNNHECIVAY